ncbi:hypothetical protein FG05_30291 [Fusarium graminearum]|nr:hypothetical protein FG05_30291 [Fusarium graminearum]
MDRRQKPDRETHPRDQATGKTLNIPDRTSSVGASSAKQSLEIPKRNSSKRTTGKRRVSQLWDAEYSDLSLEQLQLRLKSVGEELKNSRKKLKRKVSMDDEYWDTYLDVSRLHMASAQVKSQMELEEFDKPETWYDQPSAHNLKLQYDSWSQWRNIMQNHKSSLQKRLGTGRQAFVQLFATSKVGLNLAAGPASTAGQGKRDTSMQSNMAAEMKRVYCPDHPEDLEGYRWDPVVHDWLDSDIVHAAHLFPWSQGAFMDDIFGGGSSDDLFSPCNGLFLHKRIEAALENGYIAIIPDLDLEPADPMFPLNDKDDRQDRVKEWERQNPKNYRVIVVDKDHPHVNKKISRKEDMGGFQTIAELHNRKLVFLTDFRPRARYIWWTFLNTILHVAWRSNSKDQNIQHEEVRKTTRYWGTRGKYIKKNQLLGFVEEIGHNVASILTDEAGTEETDGIEPEIEATQALVGAATAKSAKEEHEALAEDDPDDDDDDDEDDYIVS